MRKSVITTLALVVFLAINYGNVQAKEIEIQQVDPLNCKLNMILAMLRFVFYLLSSILILYTIAKYNKVKKMEQKKKYDFVVKNIILAVLLFFIAEIFGVMNNLAHKPVIYIYPETETAVQVSVGHPEKLSCVYPEYDIEEGWEVIAKPNGDLVDTKTGRNLYCLYWEGNQKQEYKFKDGFVVAGEDSAKFLEEKLAILGLNEREANEFIIYWLPKLEANKYNLIRFETMEEIEEYMSLNIEPKPDTVIRVMMDFKGLNRPIEIEEQKLEQVEREGYTVVEWGGSEF